MEYTHTVFWKDVLLGDYIGYDNAVRCVNEWISECESDDAKDINSYTIMPYDNEMIRV